MMNATHTTENQRQDIQARYPDTVIFWEELDANGGKWYATYGDNAKKLAAYLEVKLRNDRCRVYETGIDAALKGMKALGHNVAVCQPR